MIHASAPGKVILFGEHAVVYGRPALAVPVLQVHADVQITPASRAGLWFEAPDIGLVASYAELEPSHPLRSAAGLVLQLVGLSTPPSLTIHITSTIPVASGLGSGAAVSVALIRALGQALDAQLSAEQVNNLAYEVEKIHHGTPSGVDNTVITYARPVYFVRGQPLETFSARQPFTIVIADTGISAPTRESVGDLRKLWQAEPARWEAVFERVAGISRQARACMESGEWRQLGPLMDSNHALLQEMTVSSPELDRLVTAARAAGALGAKLSGGGRGGNMLALVEPAGAQAVSEGLLAAGARRAIITEVR